MVILDPSRMPWYITVLATADQDNLPKVAKSASFTQLIEKTVFEGFTVLHTQLIQTLHFVHFAHYPKTSLDHRIDTVEIP